MKQFLAYIGLFCGFAAILSGARYLDDYSAQYQGCASVWKSAAGQAQLETWKAQQFLQTLETGTIIHKGHACPELRPEHAAKLRAMVLPSISKTELRGLSVQ